MGILSKENIKTAVKNPFMFVVIVLLVVLALSQSFAIWCFIGALLAIPFALLGKDSNAVISFFCSDSSWKTKSINLLVKFLGDYTIPLILLSLVIWWLLNYTEKGKEIVSLLD